MYEPIRVCLYGSSLFLTAVAATLSRHPNITLLHLPSAIPIKTILHQNPTILLWQKHCSPADRTILFNAGLWLAEIDEHKSQISVQHRSQPQKQILPINGSDNLIDWISQQVQINYPPSRSAIARRQS